MTRKGPPEALRGPGMTEEVPHWSRRRLSAVPAAYITRQRRSGHGLGSAFTNHLQRMTWTECAVSSATSSGLCNSAGMVGELGPSDQFVIFRGCSFVVLTRQFLGIFPDDMLRNNSRIQTGKAAIQSLQQDGSEEYIHEILTLMSWCHGAVNARSS